MTWVTDSKFFGICYSYHMALVWYIHYHTCCSVWHLISSTVEVWVNIAMQSNYLPQVKFGEAGRKFVRKLELYFVSLHLISAEKLPGDSHCIYKQARSDFFSQQL